MDIQKEREAFVKWFESRYIDDIHPDSTIGIVSWEAWQAQKAQAVPEGFVLVPKELSIDAIRNLDDEFIEVVLKDDEDYQDIYKAMLEAQEQTK